MGHGCFLKLTDGNPSLPNGVAKPPTFTFSIDRPRVRPMRILALRSDRARPCGGARSFAIIGRAVDWAGINSGSRNAAGLNAMLDVLEAEARRLPAEVVRIPTQGSTTVGDDGSVRAEAHADALQITARPEAPVQVDPDRPLRHRLPRREQLPDRDDPRRRRPERARRRRHEGRNLA
jgi:hypothetical protein